MGEKGFYMEFSEYHRHEFSMIRHFQSQTSPTKLELQKSSLNQVLHYIRLPNHSKETLLTSQKPILKFFNTQIISKKPIAEIKPKLANQKITSIGFKATDIKLNMFPFLGFIYGMRIILVNLI